MLHSVNLNMFGKREPVQYGTTTLDEINQRLKELAKELSVENFQTNHEGVICEKILQAHLQKIDAVVINAFNPVLITIAGYLPYRETITKVQLFGFMLFLALWPASSASSFRESGSSS